MERFSDIANRCMRRRNPRGRVEVNPDGILTIRRGDAPTEDAPVKEPEYDCHLCQDSGYIPFSLRIETEEGFRTERSRARCRCYRGAEAPDKFATYHQVFGRWPDEQAPRNFQEQNEILQDGEWVPAF